MCFLELYWVEMNKGAWRVWWISMLRSRLGWSFWGVACRAAPEQNSMQAAAEGGQAEAMQGYGTMGACSQQHGEQ